MIQPSSFLDTLPRYFRQWNAFLPAPPARRVLVVDDNEDLLHFYRRYLSDTHYQITALGDGSRIFETVARVQPDVIVLDVMLPDLDGWQLLTNLRHHPTM